MIRSELRDMIDLAERLLAADELAVLATLFSSNGSTYRRLGSMMVAGPGSISAGGVSGGCLEEYIARHGRALVHETNAVMLSFDADPDADDADKPKLGCGGSIEVLVERLSSHHLEFLRRIAAAYESDEGSTVACRVDEQPDGAMVVHRDLGSSIPGLDGPRHRWLVYDIEPMTRLVIFGAGDDVKPLCETARSLGWHVTVADRRARRASRKRFPRRRSTSRLRLGQRD